jgi:hypothetical protein
MNIIVTQSGRLGLAPRDIHVGDWIAILAAGTAPFILRKVGVVGKQESRRSAYILLGACCVDGETFASSRSNAPDILTLDY